MDMQLIKHPSIEQYLISTCLYIIDELNELHAGKSKPELKKIADTQYNEMDFTVRLGYPFRHLAHYTAGDKSKNKAAKSNHDIFVASKDFKIEVKFLKNWKNPESDNNTNSLNWEPIQQDFDWLIDEIDSGFKSKRAFIIGWFNCVDNFSSIMKLGETAGSRPIANEMRVCYFPFLKRTNERPPTYTRDLDYEYRDAYQKLKFKPYGRNKEEYNCMFIGNENDTFHFAIYF